jgi:RNA polymerase sigma factor (sigma-70 family)
MSATRGDLDAELVAAAREGDEGAWTALVERYQPVVNAITRRHRLSAADGADVSQNVWLALVNHLADLREPRALCGWISTIAARACLEVIKLRNRTVVVDPLAPTGLDQPAAGTPWETGAEVIELDEALLQSERRKAVRQGLAQLTPVQQDLLLLLVADPPLPYEQISLRLGMPVGSIGPTRARVLRKLGDTAAIRVLLGRDAPVTTAAPAGRRLHSVA